MPSVHVVEVRKVSCGKLSKVFRSRDTVSPVASVTVRSAPSWALPLSGVVCADTGKANVNAAQKQRMNCLSKMDPIRKAFE
jgi:hypothetical protein